ncbi:hypothetical protein Aab01nite_70360 [Paractinoplanes abujensis]|nr:hypothetical protein Aab01nite_70360 [Actinoplanes abujensis]
MASPVPQPAARAAPADSGLIEPGTVARAAPVPSVVGRRRLSPSTRSGTKSDAGLTGRADPTALLPAGAPEVGALDRGAPEDRSEVSESGVASPEAGEPGVASPEVEESEAGSPEAGRPYVELPDVEPPDVGRP